MAGNTATGVLIKEISAGRKATIGAFESKAWAEVVAKQWPSVGRPGLYKPLQQPAWVQDHGRMYNLQRVGSKPYQQVHHNGESPSGSKLSGK